MNYVLKEFILFGFNSVSKSTSSGFMQNYSIHPVLTADELTWFKGLNMFAADSYIYHCSNSYSSTAFASQYFIKPIQYSRKKKF